MRRRWIVSGIVFVAVVAALSVLIFSRTAAPLPHVIWYCSTSHELRESPSGAVRSDLAATEFWFVNVGAVQQMSRSLRLGRAPSLVQRANAWLSPSSRAWMRVDDDTQMMSGVGAPETADGCSWQRFEYGLPLATPR